jgi:hypothetical protein
MAERGGDTIHSREGLAMRAQDVREFVRRQPFQPFRVTLTDDRTYDVVHPDLAMIGTSAVAIGLPQPNGPQFIYDRLITVSLLHIMQIEPLPSGAAPAAGPQGNGE